MLIRDTLRYLPAQLLSPLGQLASMVLWTHWLTPAGMGIFTLVTAAQELAYVACLGWFSSYALRFLPAAGDVAGRRRYLETENAVVLASTVAGVACGGLALLAMPAEELGHDLLAAIAAYFITRACSQHYAERARAQSAFAAYTVLQLAGPVGGLGLGWLAMQQLGASPEVLLGAYAAAQAIGLLLAWPSLGMHWGLARPDTAMLRAALAFGGPMLGLTALAWMGENHIRYLVQWRDGAAALGLMTVGWSLGRRCASVSAMLVTTASFPLASRLYNEGRRPEALAQLSHTAVMLLAVLLPATTVVAVLGGRLIEPLVAPAYRELTGDMLVLAMVAGALRNMLLHVIDQVMALEMRWPMMVWMDVAEIAIGVVATLVGLKVAGLHGAVIGHGLAGAVMLGVGIHLARTRIGFQWPWQANSRVLLACAAMAVVLLPAADRAQPLPLVVLAAAVGVVVYGGAMALLFRAELRHAWQQRQLARSGSTP